MRWSHSSTCTVSRSRIFQASSAEDAVNTSNSSSRVRRRASWERTRRPPPAADGKSGGRFDRVVHRLAGLAPARSRCRARWRGVQDSGLFMGRTSRNGSRARGSWGRNRRSCIASWRALHRGRRPGLCGFVPRGGGLVLRELRVKSALRQGLGAASFRLEGRAVFAKGGDRSPLSAPRAAGAGVGAGSAAAASPPGGSR